MLINARTAISTSKILLVPYEPFHVTTYHEWMKDHEIQEATASDPLSLDEEYAMQKSWRNDPDKLTFIVCLPLSKYEVERAPEISYVSEHSTLKILLPGKHDGPERMVGDVNLFLSRDEEDEESINGELELMIASNSLRRQGLGRATVLTFLCYFEQHVTKILTGFATKEGMEKFELRQLKVKIGSANKKSIKLFESIGFIKVNEEPNYFGELELVLPDIWREELRTGAILERWGVEDYREFCYTVEGGQVKD